MEVLARLRASVQATVSTTVSQISHALPGNPVLREYDVSSQLVVCSCGPGLFWKGYAAKKKSTQQDATVFVFEKKCLEVFSKKDRELIVEFLKRGVIQLTRLRHPEILTVQHAMEESRESLAFATEPVITSLAHVLDDSEQNLEVKVHLSPVEIKYGLHQLSNSLIFLHQEAKIIHTNLSPANVVIDSKGSWKLFGFDFCASNVMQLGQTASWKCREPDNEVPSVAQADLDYLAPEFGRSRGRGSLEETMVAVTPAVDLYSMGCLIYSIFNKGKPPCNFEGDVEAFYRRMGRYDSLQVPSLSPIPLELRDLVSSLLSATPEARSDLHFILQLNYFEDPGVKALLYLDSLFQRENLHKSQFFRSLPDILPKLSTRLKIHRVVPCLDAESKATPAMVPFILPSLLAISQEVNPEEYGQFVLPTLRILMKMTEPIQIALLFLNSLDLLLDKSSVDSVKFDLTPLVSRCFDQPSLAEACLKALPKLASKLDFPTLRGTLLPRIKKLCMDSENLSLRVQGLLCLAKILDYLDKWTVLDEVLPLLQQLPGRNQSAIIMASAGIYRLALEHPKLGIPKEYLASKVLPSLWPMTVEPGLNLIQLEALLKLIKDMGEKVEVAQRQLLKSSMDLNNEHKSILENTFGTPNGSKVPELRSSAPKIRSAGTSVPQGTDQSLSHNKPDISSSSKMPTTLHTGAPRTQPSPSGKPVVPAMAIPVQPSVPMLSKPPAYQPKDLTSVLISSNLKNLSSLPLQPSNKTSVFDSDMFSQLSSMGSGVPSGNSAFSKLSEPVLYDLSSSGIEDSPLLGGGPVMKPVTRPSGMMSGFGSGQYMPIAQSSNHANTKSLGQQDIDDLLG